MKKPGQVRDFILLGLLAAWLWTAATREFWSSYTYIDSQLVIKAGYAYAKDALANKHVLPANVSLRELVSSGYLSSEKVNWGTGLRKLDFRLVTDFSSRHYVRVELRESLAGGGSGAYVLHTAG
jgi:hypothetical protein